jgi:hypothetical protein
MSMPVDQVSEYERRLRRRKQKVAASASKTQLHRTQDRGAAEDPDVAEDGPLLPTREVAARYKVCVRTVERWLDDEIGFPTPVWINNRRYFRLRKLEAFERQRVAAQI